MTVFRHLGILGLFLLAIADSTPLPTFAGPDILTAIFAARHRDPWYYYAAVTTTGSVIGAYITFRMARRAGASYMRDKFGERKVTKLLAYFERWGTGAWYFLRRYPFHPHQRLLRGSRRAQLPDEKLPRGCHPEPCRKVCRHCLHRFALRRALYPGASSSGAILRCLVSDSRSRISARSYGHSVAPPIGRRTRRSATGFEDNGPGTD